MQILTGIVIGSIVFFALWSVEPESITASMRVQQVSEGVSELERIRMARYSARDTIFVLGDRFVTIDLDKQEARLFRRDGTDTMFPVSSGSKRIHKGMETPVGLYTVQSKSPLTLSRQFDDAKLFWWVGFNGNIGFHGLEGNGYYWHLGKRPSSHGCVRIGRDDGKALYSEVRRGTPVLVHKEKPARVLAFGDSTRLAEKGVLLTSRTPEQQQLLEQRMALLYRGELYLREPLTLYLDGTTQLRPGGYGIGVSDSIAKEQQKPLDARILAFQPIANDKFRSRKFPIVALAEEQPEEQAKKE